jgi:choline-sulfatase
MLGLAGLDAEGLRQKLAEDHGEAQPLVGRNLAGLVRGQVSPDAINDPLYFMTDDDPSRGLNQNNWTGIAYASVVQPNHIETVIATLDDGNVWKYSRYFDNPQFWSSPGLPGTQGVEDVVLIELGVPDPRKETQIVPFQRTEKHLPLPEEHEMYNVTLDPMELDNLAGRPEFSDTESTLAALLEEQCARKRLHPTSGEVPGQPTCAR